jgi:hypothetical protein
MIDLPAIEVRTGTPDDLDGMMAWAEAAAKDNAVVLPDRMKLLELFWNALNCQSGIVGIVGDPDKPIEGAILLTVGALWYSQEPVLEEKVVFVLPEFRAAKGGRARRLCEFSKQASRELNLPLMIGVLSNERTKGKMKLYERMFGQPAGVYFLYGGETGLDQSETGKDNYLIGAE